MTVMGRHRSTSSQGRVYIISNYRQVPSTLSKCRRLVGQEDKVGTVN